MNNNYPFTINFKKIALTNKLTVTDNNGAVIVYAHQKMLKLKEKILLFTNSDKTTQTGYIAADKVIDFSPTYSYYDNTDTVQLSVKRQGRKSIWKAEYDVMNSAGEVIFNIKENDAWIKVFDSFLSEAPIIGLFSGYFFNPIYNVVNQSGELVAQIEKQAAFFESVYKVEIRNPNAQNLDLIAQASLILVIRERTRG